MAVDDQVGGDNEEEQSSINKVRQPRWGNELCKAAIDQGTEKKLMIPQSLILLTTDFGHVHYDEYDTGKN